MLADEITEECRGYGTRDLLAGTRKVKIHRDVYDTAMTLVAKTPQEKIADLSRFTCWPDYSTWLETEKDDEGRRLGFLFYGIMTKESSVQFGYGMLFMQYEDGTKVQVPVCYDLEKYDVRWSMPSKPKRLRELMADLSADDKLHMETLLKDADDVLGNQTKYAPLLTQVKPILFTLLALINSPKLIRTREVDVGKLNARRLKRGKYPYHPHHEVRLNIDKHILNVTQGQGDGPERCLHFVRAHLRFLVHPRYKNVSVVLVPPHTRGNPELGIMNTSYAVERKNSRWKD